MMKLTFIKSTFFVNVMKYRIMKPVQCTKVVTHLMTYIKFGVAVQESALY
jgi:hypothetical protein